MKTNQTGKPILDALLNASESLDIRDESPDTTRRQAAHSPLPWRDDNGGGINFMHTDEDGNIHGGTVAICERRGEYGAADAKLIVASVNHCERLAEALRLAIRRMDRLDDAGTGEHSFAYDNAQAKLKAYKTAQ